jgi:cytochrome c oxidase cbb3-type subunit I/II
MPRMFQAPLYSPKLANTHFWIATIGILLYIVPIYVAGLTQGLMWRAIDSSGNLAYADFVETVSALMPMYWLRVLGGRIPVLQRRSRLWRLGLGHPGVVDSA